MREPLIMFPDIELSSPSRQNPAKTLPTLEMASRIATKKDSGRARIVRIALSNLHSILREQIYSHSNEPVANVTVQNGSINLPITARVAVSSVSLSREETAKALVEILEEKVSVGSLLFDARGEISMPVPLYTIEIGEARERTELCLSRIEPLDMRGVTREEIRKVLGRLRVRGSLNCATHLEWRLDERTKVHTEGCDLPRVYPRYLNAAAAKEKNRKTHLVKEPLGTMFQLVALINQIKSGIKRVR